MGLKERLGGLFHKTETKPAAKTAKTLQEFVNLWESELGGLVYIQPSEIIKADQKGSKSRTYFLNYSSDAVTGRPMLLFQERFEGIPVEQNLHFKNVITAICRVNLLRELAGIDAYLVKDGHLGDPMESEIYPKLLKEAETRGISPFSSPIPRAFEHSLDDVPQLVI